MAEAPRGPSTCCSERSLRGVCVPRNGNCAVNSDCTGSTDTCTSGVCTCAGNPCSGTCTNGTCVQCRTTSECGGGRVCLGGRCGVWVQVSTIGQFDSSSQDADAFKVPEGAGFSGDGLTLAVADQGNHRISVWTRPDVRSFNWSPVSFVPTRLAIAGSDDGSLDNPESVVLSPDGLVMYIADTDNNRVVIWTRTAATDTSWTFQTKFGSYGTDGSAPQDIEEDQRVWISPDQRRAYVTSYGDNQSNSRVLVWERSSPTATDWAWQYNVPGDGPNIDGSGPAQFERIYGAWLTPDELTMYVADNGNDRISVWARPSIAATNTWQHQYNFGTAGESSNQFNGLETIMLSNDGLLAFMSDQDNNRVSVWSREDVASPAWTPAFIIGNQNGTDLDNPSTVATSDDFQTIYIVDQNHERVAIWGFRATAG
ncbi:MAG: hypothetical protein ACKOWF_13825 [Chloroflexota bacterium]